MRIVLLTGKGGVGKSTVAAGTAALAARAGHRTLVLSTDAAHSLADAYGLPAQTGSGPAPLGPGPGAAEPTQVAPGLFVQQVDAQRRFEASWSEIQGYLRSVLDAAGVDPVASEELTVLPGAEEVLALQELRIQVLSEEWDVVVVDCAPTAETLRLLALPEALGWYMQRIFPTQARVMRTLRPVLSRAAGVPMPGGSFFEAVERLHAELDEVRALLTGPSASVRLVLTPEQVVLAEARRAHTSLSLYGYRVDGVIANRIFPAEGADDWRAGWVMAQDRVLEEAAQSFAGLPIWRSEYRTSEPVGVEALASLAADLYAGDDPLAVPVGEGPFRVVRRTGGAELRLALPGITRGEVGLARHGAELVLDVGSYRRLLTLPAGLARLRVAGAGVEEGELRVRFVDADSTTSDSSGDGGRR